MEGIFFFLKPIVDMLYQFQFLDYIMVVLALILLAKHHKMRLHGFDILIFFLMLLFFFAFLKNENGLAAFFKIESGFLVYFLGRCYSRNVWSIIPFLKWSFLLIILITAYTFVSGVGFKEWGRIYTFCGLYFFKTDLCTAMAQCTIFFCLIHPVKKKNWFVVATCIFFTLIANARAYYFIVFFIIILAFLYYREIKTKRQIEISWKLLTIGSASIIGLLFLMNHLSTFLGDRFLLFQFDNLSDLMDSGNTQGRNEVWNDIYNRIFMRKDFITRFFGIDLCSDQSYLGFNSHNLYLKVLFSIGYFGCFFYGCFILGVVYYLNKIRVDRQLFYVTTALFSIYLFGGISYITIESTQLSWFPMFFLGIVVTKVHAQNELESYVEIRSTRNK